MTRNQKQITVVVIGAIVFLVIALMAYDWLRSGGGSIRCDGDERRLIDIREFRTTYSGYSVEIEASLNNKQKITGKLEPKQLERMSEALQQANEFRKYLVAGYNACAITKVQYADFEKAYQTLDNLARQINTIIGQPSLNENERTKLDDVVEQYLRTAERLSTK